MAETVAVKPVSADARLVHPFAGPLPSAGGRWPADQFTLRRLRDGDIVRVADAAPAVPASPADLTPTRALPAAPAPAQSTDAADAATSAKDPA